MACLPLNPLLIDGCADGTVGGISTYYAIYKSDIASYTEVNHIATPVLVATKFWTPIQVEAATSSAQNSFVRPNKFYRETVTMVLADNDELTLSTIDSLLKGQLVIIAVMENGTKKIFGLNSGNSLADGRGLESATGEWTTGVADGDVNAHTIVMNGRRLSPTPYLDDAYVIVTA